MANITTVVYTRSSGIPLDIANSTDNGSLRSLLRIPIFYRNVTTDTTVSTSTDRTLNCTGDVIVTLPTTTTSTELIFNIRNSGTGTVTLSANTTQLIEGENPQYIYEGENFTIQSTGTAWILL